MVVDDHKIGEAFSGGWSGDTGKGGWSLWSALAWLQCPVRRCRLSGPCGSCARLLFGGVSPPTMRLYTSNGSPLRVAGARRLGEWHC